MFLTTPNLIVVYKAVFYPNYFKLVYKKLYKDTSVKSTTRRNKKLLTAPKRSLKFITNILT